MDSRRDPDCEWDILAARTDGIDRWCTSSPWSASAGVAFGTGRSFMICGDVEGSAATFAVSLRDETTEAQDGSQLRVVVGPDPVWGFASAIVGNVAKGAAAAADSLLERDDWDVALFPGIEPRSNTEHAIGSQLVARFPRVGIGVDAVRLVARLERDATGGDAAQAWLLRRSPTFRRNLRRVERSAYAAGFEFKVIDGDEPADVMERLIAIEERSWKGAQDSGLVSVAMASFSRGVLDRLPPSGRRVTVARLAGRDVGFILGGVLDRGYRGVQIAYTEDVRVYSVGHLLQWHEIRRLAAEGVQRYDLGMDIAYKHRFADERYVTRSLVVTRVLAPH